MDASLAPDMMGMRRTGWRGRARAHRMPLRLCRTPWASCGLADAADGLAVHPPRFVLQEGRALPLSKARRARRKRLKARSPLSLVPLACRPPLRPAVERADAAGAPLADVLRLLSRRGRRARGSPAAPFLPRTSCHRRLSRGRSPPRRVNAACSRSSVRRRVAAATSRPPTCRRHRYHVCAASLCWRPTSRTFPAAPASCHIRLICSADKRLPCIVPPVERREPAFRSRPSKLE